MAQTISSGVDIRVEEGGQGGRGGPTLVLLHGLGANAEVWQGMLPLVRAEWPGRWIAPDLRGHGKSGHRGPYSYAGHAADVAGLLQQDEEAIVVGHSMGGAIGMVLASQWYGVVVRKVIAFGVKIRWTPEEIAKARQLAKAPVRWFDGQAEAVERYLKVSGLFGLIDPASPAAQSGVRHANGRYRLASDPLINAAVGPEVAWLIGAAHAPVRLAAGAKDPMVNLADMLPFDAKAKIFDGAGHNLQVEQPAALWQFVRGETL